jgi:imidazolonepropionase-like amidohydrolase
MRSMKRGVLALTVFALLALFAVPTGSGSTALAQASPTDSYVLQPSWVFDGFETHEGWFVVVEGDRITEVGPPEEVSIPRGSQDVELEGMTLLPGLIEGHSHILLHPYNETPWTDQVLNESLAQRTARAVVHVRDTLRAGITTLRDLGTEGAGYADVGIKEAIDLGVIPGPRLLVSTKAIVATGSYNPKGAPEHHLPKGAEEADGYDDLVRVTRDQIGRGADWVKVYADYRWGPGGTAQPTFTEDELRTIVEVSESSGRHVVAHASSAEAIRRSVVAGIKTIEHGDGGTPEVWRLMAEQDVALCPTLAAGYSILTYSGWRPGVDPDPERIVAKKASFRAALEAGVPMCFGGDVGVYTHGTNVLELELMVEYGMTDLDALRAATSGNARILELDEKLGVVRAGLLADLIAVDGRPAEDITALRNIRFVMKGGKVYWWPHSGE